MALWFKSILWSFCYVGGEIKIVTLGFDNFAGYNLKDNY